MPKPTPLDDVEFLARSPHRVEVLRTLSEGPWTRPKLHDETGISQPTLGRVLGSLQDRNWVEQAGRTYQLTPLGGLVMEAFEHLLDTVETVQHLGDVIGLLPTDEMDFDLRHFGEAEILTPDTGDVFSHVRRVEELVYGAGHLRLLSVTTAPGTSDDHASRYEAFKAGDQVVESVLTSDTLDKSTDDPQFVEWGKELLASDRVSFHLYDGTIPLMAGIADGTAFLVPMDDQGFPAALIETTDGTVRTWVDELIDHYISESTELTADDLPT